jgi:hypothetical protein
MESTAQYWKPVWGALERWWKPARQQWEGEQEPIGDSRILVAALADIIKSKKAAGRPRDIAVLPILEKVLEEATREQKGPPAGSQK